MCYVSASAIPKTHQKIKICFGYFENGHNLKWPKNWSKNVPKKWAPKIFLWMAMQKRGKREKVKKRKSEKEKK